DTGSRSQLGRAQPFLCPEGSAAPTAPDSSPPPPGTWPSSIPTSPPNGTLPATTTPAPTSSPRAVVVSCGGAASTVTTGWRPRDGGSPRKAAPTAPGSDRPGTGTWLYPALAAQWHPTAHGALPPPPAP